MDAWEREATWNTFGAMVPTEECLPMFVVYDRPLDYPKDVVIRRNDVTFPSGGRRVWNYVILFRTVDEARQWIRDGYPHLHQLSRCPDDEPQIVEVWL
jgi:hypothetical protein